MFISFVARVLGLPINRLRFDPQVSQEANCCGFSKFQQPAIPKICYETINHKHFVESWWPIHWL